MYMYSTRLLCSIPHVHCYTTPCRFVNEEEQRGSVVQQNSGLQRQVQQLEAALQELGREHQTLQVMQSRQSQRRWESDKDVLQCSSCGKKFSVSVRRVSGTCDAVCVCVCIPSPHPPLSLHSLSPSIPSFPPSLHPLSLLLFHCQHIIAPLSELWVSQSYSATSIYSSC